MNKPLKVPFDAPLNELDSEVQTFGCRQKNPDICGNNSLPAFALLLLTTVYAASRQERGSGNM